MEEIKKKKKVNTKAIVIAVVNLLIVVGTIVGAFFVSVPTGLFCLIGYPVLYFAGFCRGWFCRVASILKQFSDSIMKNFGDILKGETLDMSVTDEGKVEVFKAGKKPKTPKNKKEVVKDTIKED